MQNYDVQWEVIRTNGNSIEVKYTCETSSIVLNIPLDDASQLNDRIKNCGPYDHFLRTLNPELIPDFSELVGASGSCVLSPRVISSNIPKATP